MSRVTTGGKQQETVACPGCGRPAGLWLNLLDPDESAKYRASHALADVTASLVEPKDRLAAMNRAADNEGKSMLVPWVACLSCGHDDHYVFGVSGGPA